MSAKPLCLTQTGQWEKSAFSFTVGNQDLQRPSLLSTVGAAQGLWLSLIIPCPSIPASSILFSFSHYFVFILFIIVVVVFTVLSVMKHTIVLSILHKLLWLTSLSVLLAAISPLCVTLTPVRLCFRILTFDWPKGIMSGYLQPLHLVSIFTKRHFIKMWTFLQKNWLCLGAVRTASGSRTCPPTDVCSGGRYMRGLC